MASVQSAERRPAERPAARAGLSAWPAPPASLAALADMGMSDEAIGRYFGVDPEVVRTERGREPAG